jgi:DGQHR domain-containing protein
MSKSQKSVLNLSVIRGQVLGVTVLRGYARLSDLARISKPDIYDQKFNPTGTQRDLNPKHARNAYEYVKKSELGFWPEVFLSVRFPEVIEFKESKYDENIGDLLIDLKRLKDTDGIAISRVDGNHRLHYADGKHKGYPPIDKSVSFCLAYDLSLEKEITLFRDINNNQRRMNTSHLDNIEARLTPEEQLKREDPSLWIARELGLDKESPLYGLIYEGGKKTVGQLIPLRTLKTGISYMLSRPTKLTDLGHTDAQYKLIRNYFHAVKLWQPQSWITPKKYLVLRGSGLWGICFIGADVIDQVLSQGKFEIKNMLEVLKSGNEWDWSNTGDFRGLAGRGGSMRIREIVISEFQSESGPSMKELWRKIMQE